jgi:16S rRNA A1518/A1519 N6-dimethyltransferase RsmA/KsgA/DIM1 with predicted DNA glycosylase/AP lyase activity
MAVCASRRTELGWADPFNVDRVAWPNSLFDISGKSVLELGPLEGGHSFALHNIGASTITAIEGNSRAFLKCLIVKELFDLSRVKLLYGDFVKYLEKTTDHFDIIFASGVPYHMCPPLQLLSLIKQHTNQCYIWAHYYDQHLLQDALGDQFVEKCGSKNYYRIQWIYL